MLLSFSREKARNIGDWHGATLATKSVKKGTQIDILHVN